MNIQGVILYQKTVSKNGKAPIMRRITVNGAQAGFCCKREVSLPLWDVKANGQKANPKKPVR